jgi:hypothetical protein
MGLGCFGPSSAVSYVHNGVVMAVDKLAETYLSCLIRDFERPVAAGVDLIFFCYQNGIASINLQPFVAKLKSEGSLSEPCFVVYALTASGYERYRRCANKTRLRRMASRWLSRKVSFLLRANGTEQPPRGNCLRFGKRLNAPARQRSTGPRIRLLDRFRRSRGLFRQSRNW